MSDYSFSVTNSKGAKIGTVWRRSNKDWEVEHVSGEYGSDMINSKEEATQTLMNYHQEWVIRTKTTINRLTRQLNRWS